MENKIPEYPETALDVCCGSRMFYFNKNTPAVHFNDWREVDEKMSDGRKLVIKPDTLHDFRHLPWEDGIFPLVIFDPPHLNRAGASSWLARKYGVLPKNWQPYIKAGFDEAWRVLATGGTLIMKWSTVQIPARDLFKAIGREPLLGDKKGKTRWLIFFKDGREELECID